VVSQILATREYRQDLVILAYVDLLHRQADPAGLAGWVNLLNSGGTDQMVYAGMCSSQEYYDKTLA